MEMRGPGRDEKTAQISISEAVCSQPGALKTRGPAQAEESGSHQPDRSGLAAEMQEHAGRADDQAPSALT